MLFKKRLLASEITLIISVGILLIAFPRSAESQLPQYNCRPNNAGDGWICERTGPLESRNNADTNERGGSDTANLPDNSTPPQPRERSSTPLQPGSSNPALETPDSAETDEGL